MAFDGITIANVVKELKYFFNGHTSINSNGDFLVFNINPAKITGKFEYGLLYDIDMNYFLQGIVDLDCYPDWLKKKIQRGF